MRRSSRQFLGWLVAWTASLLGGGIAGAAEPEISTPTAWQAYLVFEQSCAECHGGHLAKPKGKFGYVLDLRRLVTEGKIAPGHPETSDVYLAITSTDEEEQMPPPDSDGAKPTAEQIAKIHDWIAAGALIDEQSTPPREGTATAPVAAQAAPRPLGQIIGRLHPVLVHFPIALLLTACVTEIFSRLRPGIAGWAQGTTRGSLWGAAGGAIIAAACGWLHAPYEGFSDGAVALHRWLGVGTAALAVIAFLVSEWAERARARDATRGSRGLLLGVLIVAVVVVTLAGHTGGLLAYGDDYFNW